MGTTSETLSLFRRLFLVSFILILFASCESNQVKEMTFYHPNKALEKHSIPVFATLHEGNVLEQEHSFQFKGNSLSELFRFRISYFNVSADSFNTETNAIEITQSHVKDVLRLEKNTIYQLQHPLFIDSSAVLLFEEGSQLYVDDAIDIINKGSIVIKGQKNNPVLITALQRNWGGIQSYGGEIDIKHLIITQSGGNDSIKVRHSYSQPAIYMVEDGKFTASNLYIANCLGKALYIHGSRVKINKSLFADCDTGPEINWSKVEIDSIICMNIPDAFEGEDDDNDALYIYGRHKMFFKDPPRLNHIMLGFAKDDGFDHGKNDMDLSNMLVYKVKDKAISLEGGNMNLTNIWLSDARVLLGVKQNTHAKIDSIYLSDSGKRTDILENMQQDPTLEISNEFSIEDKAKDAEEFWFSVF